MREKLLGELHNHKGAPKRKKQDQVLFFNSLSFPATVAVDGVDRVIAPFSSSLVEANANPTKVDFGEAYVISNGHVRAEFVGSVSF